MPCPFLAYSNVFRSPTLSCSTIWHAAEITWLADPPESASPLLAVGALCRTGTKPDWSTLCQKHGIAFVDKFSLGSSKCCGAEVVRVGDCWLSMFSGTHVSPHGN